MTHSWLKDVKAQSNLNYSEIGNIIKYSGAGISKALKKETLSIDQIKAIAKGLNLLEGFNLIFEDVVEKDEGGYVISGSMGTYLNRNHDRLMLEDTTYNLWFTKETTKEAMKILKDLLSQK